MKRKRKRQMIQIIKQRSSGRKSSHVNVDCDICSYKRDVHNSFFHSFDHSFIYSLSLSFQIHRKSPSHRQLGHARSYQVRAARSHPLSPRKYQEGRRCQSDHRHSLYGHLSASRSEPQSSRKQEFGPKETQEQSPRI